MVVRKRTAQDRPRGMSTEDAKFLRDSEALAAQRKRDATSGRTRFPAPAAAGKKGVAADGGEEVSEGLRHMPIERVRAAQEAASELKDTKRRQEAEKLRAHLDASTQESLGSLQKERQSVVLMGLKKQLEVLREAASREHTRLLDGAATADETAKHNRAAIAQFMAKSDAELIPEVERSVAKAIERQRILERQYKQRTERDRKTIWFALMLTALIFGFVIWAGMHLSHSKNLYRFMRSVYRVWDGVWPGSRKGTLFSEPGDSGNAANDEYSFYA